MHTRSRRLAAAGVLLVLGFGVSSVARAQELSGDAQRVVDYLLDDWAKQFRSTSIPLAMENLEMAPSDAMRLEIGQHFRDHTDLANNLRFWGANNYIFTNEEKRSPSFSSRRARTPDERRCPTRRPVRWGSRLRLCALAWHSWRRPGFSSEIPVRSWDSHWRTGTRRGVDRFATIFTP